MCQWRLAHLCDGKPGAAQAPPPQSAHGTPWPKGLSHRLTSTQETQRLSHPLLLPQSRLSVRAACHVGTGNLYSNTKHKRCQPPLRQQTGKPAQGAARPPAVNTRSGARGALRAGFQSEASTRVRTAEQLSGPRCASPRLALHPGEAPTQDWAARLTASPADPARTPHQDDTRHKATFSGSVLGEFSRLNMVLTLAPRRPHLPPPGPLGAGGDLGSLAGPRLCGPESPGPVCSRVAGQVLAHVQ